MFMTRMVLQGSGSYWRAGGRLIIDLVSGSESLEQSNCGVGAGKKAAELGQLEIIEISCAVNETHNIQSRVEMVKQNRTACRVHQAAAAKSAPDGLWLRQPARAGRGHPNGASPCLRESRTAERRQVR